ncbi:MAG: hypothetical protein OER88_05230 [Planctomycetota bacterium]|nr:hypothetical protein [Planctomycetota bacterium]
MKRGSLFVLLLAACATQKRPEQDPPANRDDVTSALYQQFDLTLARHESLRGDETAAGQVERQELAQLADEIAMKIVRIDPNADVQQLIERLERTR